MVCESCNPGESHETGGFTTQEEYIAERNRIDVLIASDSAQIETTDGFEVKFICASCGQHWHLSAPDGAYRGFLKKISKYFRRIAEIKAKNL